MSKTRASLILMLQDRLNYKLTCWPCSIDAGRVVMDELMLKCLLWLILAI